MDQLTEALLTSTGILWEALFLGAGSDSPSFWAVLENSAVAPVVAFFTFIGSMDNIPLAAMLWSKNASFGGVMAFAGADLVAAMVMDLHAKYYGWHYAGHFSLLLYVSMVAAGVTVHYTFAPGIIPSERPHWARWSASESRARSG